MAAKFGAALTLCVVNVVHGGPRAPIIRHWTDDEVEKILGDATALAVKHGAAKPHRKDLIGREAATAIVHYAETNGYDHIVMGTGNKRGMSRLILGSVAADVSGRAHVSVTVAR
jgi:nucleotide-binding universal stress UspA family protein